MWDRTITHTPATASYWAAQSKFSDTVVQAASGSLSASRATINWSRSTPAGTQEDFASFTMHFCVHVGAGSYVQLDATQKADAETDLAVFVASLRGEMSNQFTHVNTTWHDVVAGDQFYGPADRITANGLTGQVATSRLPDQLAVNVTLRTSSRKHWGRFYIPGIASTKFDLTYGRPTSTVCDTLATATRTLGTSLMANTAATELVVYSHQHQAVLSVDEIHCDNVADVIRRRRAKMVSYRKAFTS
jgi:hypothetical protein